MNITTGEVRFSFCNIFKPKAYQPGGKEQYSLTILLPKSDVETKQKLDAAVEDAKQYGIKERWGGQLPPNLHVGIWDGDSVKADGTPFGPECKGCWVFTAKANADRPPQIVDEYCQPILNASEVYSGCYGRVSVGPYPYNYAGNKGIGFGLGPVQKLRDGEPLGGGIVTAESAFGAPTTPPQPAQAQIPPQPQQYAQINPITGLPM